LFAGEKKLIYFEKILIKMMNIPVLKTKKADKVGKKSQENS
jgi:hypothetical protein